MTGPMTKAGTTRKPMQLALNHSASEVACSIMRG